MRFIHIADIHANKDRYPLINKAFDKLISFSKEENVDAVLIAGDFWDSSITNTEASHFVDYIKLFKNLLKVTNVVMIYGTPSHDAAGSLEIFKSLKSDNLCYVSSYSPKYEKVKINKKEIELITIPEPRLSMISGDTLEEKYRKIQKSYDITVPERQEELPRICMFHGDVAGMKLQNDAVISEGNSSITVNKLKSYNADYYALGHIHKPQELPGLNGGYSGSLVPKDFGEAHDACFWEFEVW